MGFRWPDSDGALDKVREELDEVERATVAQQAHEVGDLLAAVMTLATTLGVDPELALRSHASRFRQRFERTLALADGPPSELSDEQWLALWRTAGADPT
jgi:ATP diphosphatase